MRSTQLQNEQLAIMKHSTDGLKAVLPGRIVLCCLQLETRWQWSCDVKYPRVSHWLLSKRTAWQ